MTEPLLMIGLLALFAGLCCLPAALSDGERTSGVSRSLAAIDAIKGTAPFQGTGALAPDLQRSFAERVLGPLVLRAQRLGRRLTPEDRFQRIRMRLDLAGNPSGWTGDRIVGIKVLGSGMLGILALVVSMATHGSLPRTLGLVLLLGTAGWFAPSGWLRHVAEQRAERVRHDLPDALDLLTISVESGLTFDAALAQVAAKTQGPLALEFARVLQEMQIGTGRIEALRALTDRTTVPELRSFVGAMVQADSFGVSIGDVLRVQSKEMRIKRTQRAEERAQKIPVKVLFPLMLCILPSLFVVIMGPAAINIMQTFSRMP